MIKVVDFREENIYLKEKVWGYFLRAESFYNVATKESLSGTLLIVLLFLLKPLFRDRISKRCQYYMWMIVIMRLLVPFTLPVSPVNTLFQEVDRSMVEMAIISEEEKTYPLHEGEDPHSLHYAV